MTFLEHFFNETDIEISNFRPLRGRYRNFASLRARARGYGDTGISLALPYGAGAHYLEGSQYTATQRFVFR